MQEIAERDFTRALELELPRAATSIRLSPTTDRYQSCVIGFDDGKTTEATFKPDALSDSVLFAFATRDPVDKFRAAVGARGVSAAQMRAIVRQCVKSGILYDRYHSSPI
jgi:hypothetical protein